MNIKGELNREVAKKVYRTYEDDGIFVVLDNDGVVGVEFEGKGYITDNVEELYEVFDQARIDFMIRQAMDVPICPVCHKPIDPSMPACPEHMPKRKRYDSKGIENLASAICVQAIKDYDRELDAYAQDPLDFTKRDAMLRTEMWIRGDDWNLYTMGKVDPLVAIESRRKEARKRYERKMKKRYHAYAERKFKSLIEEIEALNKKLEEYENSTAEGESE